MQEMDGWEVDGGGHKQGGGGAERGGSRQSGGGGAERAEGCIVHPPLLLHRRVVYCIGGIVCLHLIGPPLPHPLPGSAPTRLGDRAPRYRLSSSCCSPLMHAGRRGWMRSRCRGGVEVTASCVSMRHLSMMLICMVLRIVLQRSRDILSQFSPSPSPPFSLSLRSSWPPWRRPHARFSSSRRAPPPPPPQRSSGKGASSWSRLTGRAPASTRWGGRGG